MNSPDWGREVKAILEAGIQRPKKGHDAGDHPPITPMKAATEAELGHEAWKLYDYITRHFIGSVRQIMLQKYRRECGKTGRCPHTTQPPKI